MCKRNYDWIRPNISKNDRIKSSQHYIIVHVSLRNKSQNAILSKEFNLNEISIDFSKAVFLKSAPDIGHLPDDTGIEIAFAGRSNAGKSSALNTLTNQKGLARTSKTPGRTQLINLFSLSQDHRLVDLPGYGYAKVPISLRKEWQKSLSEYLDKRQCLKAMVVLMDIRHPLKETDMELLAWAASRGHCRTGSLEIFTKNPIVTTVHCRTGSLEMHSQRLVAPFRSVVHCRTGSLEKN